MSRRDALAATGRSTLVVVVCALGGLGGIGSFLVGVFERDGFGRPRDSEPRMWVLALAAAGVAASVLVPAIVAVVVMRASRRAAAVAAAVAFTLGVIVFAFLT